MTAPDVPGRAGPPLMRRPSLRAMTAALAVLLNLLPLWREPHQAAGPASFRLPGPEAPSGGAFASGSADPDDHLEELIDPEMRSPTVHDASLCELADGGLAAAWYGGTREGHRDVAIYFSTRSKDKNGGWSGPSAVVTRESAMHELRRYVRKVGNAVLFSDPQQGGLGLAYVSVAAGGWSGSSLNVKRSNDGGETWTSSRRLSLSPFFNISELAKNKPLALEPPEAGCLLPIYHEAMGKFPELLPLGGRMEGTKSRIFGGRTAIQPSLVALSGQEALAFCRPVDGSRKVVISRTTDVGRNWTAPQPIDLPNPDSGLDALRMSDGRLLLAFNDSAKGRDNLKLAVSADGALSWKRAVTLENEVGEEFSYPFLLQTRDGRVHVVYTWKRRGIKHHAFSIAWLDSRMKAGTP